MLRTEVKLLDKRLAGKECYATKSAAGIDLRACRIVTPHCSFILDENNPSYTLRPGEQIMIGSGLAIHLESMVYDQDGVTRPVVDNFASVASMILPRSGLGTKHGIQLANTVGLVDADYQGELMMAVKHNGSEPFTINALERIAQMVIVPVYRTEVSVVEEFSSASERGEGGFGSTGQK